MLKLHVSAGVNFHANILLLARSNVPAWDTYFWTYHAILERLLLILIRVACSFIGGIFIALLTLYLGCIRAGLLVRGPVWWLHPLVDCSRKQCWVFIGRLVVIARMASLDSSFNCQATCTLKTVIGLPYWRGDNLWHSMLLAFNCPEFIGCHYLTGFNIDFAS